MLNECGKFVDDLKDIDNLINKNFVNIADKLLEEKGFFCVKNYVYCSGSVKIFVVFSVEILTL